MTILLAILSLFVHSDVHASQCELRDEAIKYSSFLGCSSGRSESCFVAAALGGGAYAKHRENSPARSWVKELNELNREAKVLEVEKRQATERLRTLAARLQKEGKLYSAEEFSRYEKKVAGIKKLNLKDGHNLVYGEIRKFNEMVGERLRAHAPNQNFRMVPAITDVVTNIHAESPKLEALVDRAEKFPEPLRRYANLVLISRMVQPDPKLIKEYLKDARKKTHAWGREAGRNTALGVLAGSAAIVGGTLVTSSAMAKCAPTLGLNEEAAKELSNYLEPVSLSDASNCKMLRVSVNRLEERLDEGQEVPKSVCMFMAAKNLESENEGINSVPKREGNCAKSEVSVAGKRIGTIEKKGREFDLQITRSDNKGTIVVPYKNVGGNDFYAPDTTCSRADGKIDPGCTTNIRNLYLHLPGVNDDWKKNIAHTQSTCGSDSVNRNDMCDFTKSVNSLRTMMSIHVADCEAAPVANSKTVESQTTN